MNSSGLISCIDKGAKAIALFVTEDKPVPYNIRRLVRDMQDFLPQAATVSRKLSLHLLGTNRNNTICLFHQHHRHAKFQDGFGNEKHVLVRVPYQKFVASSREDQQAPQAGYMHCGCNVDVALLDFFWWKTWVLKSTRPDFEYSEGMGDEVIQPRVRAFFAQAFTEATGMTVDDLY